MVVANEFDTCSHCHHQLFGGTHIEATLLQSSDEPTNARDAFFSIGDVLVEVNDGGVS
jgi:hypothetical protein